MKIIINPLESIQFDGKKIPLKCSREFVESILGEPHINEVSYYYFENNLRFDFNKNNELEFIEFLGGIHGTIQPEIYGINPFTEDADKVYAVLSEHNNGDIDDSENGYSYAFIESAIGVYRPSIPEDVSDMVESCKQIGETLSEEEYAHEYERANHWATIGLGVKGYYNIRNLEEKLFRVEDIKKLYSAFLILCDFVEEDIYCGKCPLWKDMCGADDKTKVNEFSEALKRIRYIAEIKNN